MKQEEGSHVCTVCHSIIKPNKTSKSSFLMEAIVWIICLIAMPFSIGVSLVPAILFSLWRMISKIIICPECQAIEIVPIKTPAAQQIIYELNSKKEKEE